MRTLTRKTVLLMPMPMLMQSKRNTMSKEARAKNLSMMSTKKMKKAHESTRKPVRAIFEFHYLSQMAM